MAKHTSGPWAREYACGCREALDDGEATGRDDTCPRHGEHAVVVGFLTPELVAEDLLEALEGLAGCCTLSSKAQVAAHDKARAAIAKATGDES